MIGLEICLAVGYAAGICGFLPGALFAKASGALGNKWRAVLMGFTGGLLIAFVCFEMLANALVHQNVFVISSGIFAGVVVAAMAEIRIELVMRKFKGEDTAALKSAPLTAFGIALHNIPEGMALGALLAASPRDGYKMAVIIAIHCFPEAIAIAFPLIRPGIGYLRLSAYALLLAVPLAAGSALGAAASGISPLVSAILLSFSGGVMIYITCGEILPESRELWKGRATTAGACLGFIAGIIATAKL